MTILPIRYRHTSLWAHSCRNRNESGKFLAWKISPRFIKTTILGACLSLTLGYASFACAEMHEWTRQLGTSKADESRGVSVDRLGNVYIAGSTRGDLEGTNTGRNDAFLSKYDASGILLWMRQFGTSGNDQAQAVSTDGMGNIYISGTTAGSLGETNAGDRDAFICKYDSSGSLLWTRQLGTSSREEGSGVSTDGLGGVYLSGVTRGSLGGPNAGASDAFLSKYDADGTLLWTQQQGTSGTDYGQGVSADGLGNVYLSGVTEGNLGRANDGGYDSFLSKYDANGTLQWTRQLGTSVWTPGTGVSADRLGNIYISGVIYGSLGGDRTGGWKTFVCKYKSNGALQWTRQLDTRIRVVGSSVFADGLGSVYLSGATIGSRGGPTVVASDAFLSKYHTSGKLQWTRQLGTYDFDYGQGLAADGLGSVYISGRTYGSLGATNAGGGDAFVTKYGLYRQIQQQ